MKKGLFLLITSTLTTSSLISAPQIQPFPDNAFANYDIRNENKKEGVGPFSAYREKAITIANPQTLATVHQLLLAGRTDLLARIPNLRVEENLFGTAPEIIDVTGATAALSASSNEAREPLVRRFVVENAALFGLTPEQVRQLQVIADYTNPAGNLSWVEYEQRINGIPVFQGYLRAEVTADGRIWRTTGNPAAGLDYTRLPARPGISPVAAAVAAAKTIGITLTSAELRTISSDAQAHMTKLAQGPFTEEIKVELFYFPLEPGLATLAYSMVLWESHDAYWIIVDADNGQLLWRKNITNDQTQSVTYSVYDDDSPTPLSPSNALPGSGIQGTAISRSTITNISELPAFDNLGWIPDGAGNAVTTGNNVDAGLDIDGTNGIDAGGRATATGRVFNFLYAPGGTAGEEAPTSTAYRMGVVTNLFFWSNRYHDRLYQYGFTEPARNFQNNNFGRGGVGADYVRGEAQDSSGTNNANFSTPADGSLPRMQMYIFTGPAIDRDGDIDGDVYLHELTHGTSNRLHANASGLATTQSGGMGEGWSDYYARSLLSSASEDVNGIYAAGGYVTLNYTNGGSEGTDNYYYGIRRFPYAVKTNVGGPTALRPGQPHNPLTFADIDVALNSIVDGAYDKNPATINTANEAHRIGEIWCMMLLEMRARIITRMGWATGNDRAIQIVTDGMKLDPASPTIIQARNSILAADCAGFGGADEQDIWAGFAARGAGASASTTGGTTSSADVIEAFDLPNLTLNAVTFTDTDGNGNGNGFADPGETLALTIPIANPYCGTAANTVTAAVTGGGTGNYGTIAGGAVGSQAISYTVPMDTPCGTLLTIPVEINSSLGPVTRNFTLFVGQPIIGFTEAFDGVVAPALPAGWTTAHTGSLANWVTSTTNPSNAPNDAFSNEVTTAATSELVSPSISINSAAAQLIFRNLFNLETTFDGMVLEISIPSVAGGAFQDILVAGGSFPVGGNGYNSSLSTSSGNPLAGRQCWSGLSAGTTSAPAYITTTVNLPAAANGQSIKLKWRRGDDTGTVATGAAGARIDDIKVATSATCAAVVVTTPTPTPITPTPTPAPSPSPTPTPTPTPTASISPTPTPGVAVLSPLKDNTLYEDVNGQLSNGQGIYIFCGKTGANLLRRALIAFDLSSIPTNAIVTSATLSMFLSQAAGGAQPISLSVVSQDWGEGASDAGDPGGAGTQAAPNDATWLHTFYNTNFWNNPGGDFSPTVSATTTVSSINTTYFWSGSGLAADVQSWVSNPTTNFGWVVRGNEVSGGVAQRFNSGENSLGPPQLTVTFSVPTPTPTPVTISGNIDYCSNPSANAVPGVTLTLTGDAGGSTLSDGSGNYAFTNLVAGGNYTITPSKAALSPGATGINTVDVVAIQRHFLILGTPLSGCRLLAADVNGVNGVNTVDVIAVQRFFLALTTGTANVGKYGFMPTNRGYTGVVTDQTNQNYDGLVFGDVATTFVH